MESEQGGWVTAGAMGGDSSPGWTPNQFGDMNSPLGFAGPGGGPGGPGGAGMGFGNPAAEGIDAWFAVEPAGALALHLNFG
jgi:hypothetical protein